MERNKSGTGLGLSICKKIIEQMGGSVEVNSELGQGTEFVLTLRMKCVVRSPELDVEMMKELNKNEKEFCFISKIAGGTELKTCIKDDINQCFNQMIQKNKKEVSQFTTQPSNEILLPYGFKEMSDQRISS